MKFFFFCIFIFYHTNIYALPWLNFKTDKLPVEMILIGESLNKLNLSSEEISFISNKIQSLNRIFKFLTKDQLFFLLKSEIYKNVLEKDFYSEYKIMKFTNIDIENIEKNYQKNKIDYHPFSRWLVESVLSDFRELKNYPGFNLIKLDVPEKDPMLNLIRKKISLLSPWLGAINQLNPKEFNSKIKKIILKILFDLEISGSLFKNLGGSFEKIPQDFMIVNLNSEKKLPLKNIDEVELKEDQIQLENKQEKKLDEEIIKAKSLTEKIDISEAVKNSQEEKAKTELPRTWKPSYDRDIKGRPLPPPAKAWTPTP